MRQPTSLRQRRGTIAIIMAVCASLLISFLAISVDGGVLQDERRHAQATADAAALAGAAVIYEEYPRHEGKDAGGHVRQAVLRCAAQNGYTNDRTNSIVDVNIPP